MSGTSGAWKIVRLAALACVGLTACAAWAQDTARRMPTDATKVRPSSTGGRSVALVIGNKAYPRRPLVNPENDARDLARVLKEELGFEVELVLDATKARMAEAVETFTGKLGRDDVGLFYFAGHGVQVKGENYLLPVDFAAKTETGVEWEAYSARRVLAEMTAKGSRLSLLILDACRDNPYRSWRSGAGGLAAMQGATGALVAFAAADGATAEENPTERNGLFTKHLLKELKVSGLSAGQVFDRVREGVWKESNGRQTPFSYSGVIGEYVFRPVAAAPGAATPGTSGLDSRDREFWNEVKGSVRIADFRAYRKRFPEGLYVDLADARIAELEAATASAVPAAMPAAARPVPAPSQRPPPTSMATVVLPQPAADAAAPEVSDPAAGKEITDSIGMKLVWVPPGEFKMGSSTSEEARGPDEEPVHRVKLTKGYYLGKYEVTQREWQAVMGSNPSRFTECGQDCPVEQVSWKDVQEFLRKLGKREGVTYRLPTEAEWEYAARAGSQEASYWSVDSTAWHEGNSWGTTHRVGEKQGNAWGLHDLLGNVWEWVGDWKGGYSAGAQMDPKGPSGGSERVVRGGGWNDSESVCRTASRVSYVPGDRGGVLGFRVVRGQ